MIVVLIFFRTMCGFESSTQSKSIIEQRPRHSTHQISINVGYILFSPQFFFLIWLVNLGRIWIECLSCDLNDNAKIVSMYVCLCFKQSSHFDTLFSVWLFYSFHLNKLLRCWLRRTWSSQFDHFCQFGCFSLICYSWLFKLTSFANKEIFSIEPGDEKSTQ